MSRFWRWMLMISVPLGAALGAVAYLMEQARTGNPNLDRWPIRGRVASWAAVYLAPRVFTDPAVIRALMAIVHNESNGDPKNYLGDTGATTPYGPSIGPMQVYQRTAVNYGLWRPSAGVEPYTDAAKQEYAALKDDENRMIRWGVQVFAAKLKEQAGNVAEAMRAYNGSGPMAEAYRDRAVAWAGGVWGGLNAAGAPVGEDVA